MQSLFCFMRIYCHQSGEGFSYPKLLATYYLVQTQYTKFVIPIRLFSELSHLIRFWKRASWGAGFFFCKHR